MYARTEIAADQVTNPMRERRSNFRSERGEATSWLVLILGLVFAAVAAGGPVANIFGGLVDQIETTAVGEAPHDDSAGGDNGDGNIDGVGGDLSPEDNGAAEDLPLADSADPGVPRPGPTPEITPPPADGTGETVGDYEVRAADAVDGDAAAEAALRRLLASEAFSELPEDVQIALLAQVENYPDALSVANLARLVEKEWFQEMDLEDAQRAAKFVAALSVYEGGDADILRNSLDVILDPNSDTSFGFKAYTNDPNTITFGTARASENIFWLNEVLISVGNDPLDLGFHWATEQGLTNTFAHEVSHIVNGDAVSATFDYFMAEYRANIVGTTAQTGEAPTVDSALLGNLLFLLDQPPGSTSVYLNITNALADEDEGPLIADFVSEILGEELEPGEVIDALDDAKAAAEQAEADAAAALAQWEQDRADAIAAGDPVPPKPADVSFPVAPTPVPGVEGGPNVLDNSVDYSPPGPPTIYMPPPPTPPADPVVQPPSPPPSDPSTPVPPPGAPAPPGAELPTIELIDESRTP